MKGEKHPTLKQLEVLAKKVRLPIGYFFLSKAPDHGINIPYFRTVKDENPINLSPELIDTVYSMQRRQLWLREYLIENGATRLQFINSAKCTDSPVEVANSIRDYLGLKEDWAAQHPTWQLALRHLVTVTDKSEINIVVNGIVANNTHRKLNPREFRGFVLKDDFAPFLFINNADGKAAQMFTLAHELAHLWCGSSAIFDLARLQPADDDVEIFCNKVAAEFLVSSDNLRKTWDTTLDKSDIYQDLAKIYKVSEIVIARRLLDLRLINKVKFFKFYKDYMDRVEEQMRTASGGDYYNNQGMRVGKNFMQAVVQAMGDGGLQPTDAFRLTNLYGKTFDTYAQKALMDSI
ncbi:MAG: ImmA/IrrE family metallo-endopeptidase [Candidatus Cloacimonetes bacterium]|nr:ImmA/IrrE family metallo-endopeptidase [Candidatus Cloacimonadota bacterium]